MATQRAKYVDNAIPAPSIFVMPDLLEQSLVQELRERFPLDASDFQTLTIDDVHRTHLRRRRKPFLFHHQWSYTHGY